MYGVLEISSMNNFRFDTICNIYHVYTRTTRTTEVHNVPVCSSSAVIKYQLLSKVIINGKSCFDQLATASSSPSLLGACSDPQPHHSDFFQTYGDCDTNYGDCSLVQSEKTVSEIRKRGLHYFIKQ